MTSVVLSDVEIDCPDTVCGPTMVFARGADVSGVLRDEVVRRLSDSHRRTVPTRVVSAKVVTVEDSSTAVIVDRPDEIADVIGQFVNGSSEEVAH